MPAPRRARLDGPDHGRVGGGRVPETAALRVRHRRRSAPRPAQEPGPGPRRRKARSQQLAALPVRDFHEDQEHAPGDGDPGPVAAGRGVGPVGRAGPGQRSGSRRPVEPLAAGRPGPAAGHGPGRTARGRLGSLAMGANSVAAAVRTPRFRHHPPFARHVRRAGVGDRQRLGAAETARQGADQGHVLPLCNAAQPVHPPHRPPQPAVPGGNPGPRHGRAVPEADPRRTVGGRRCGRNSLAALSAGRLPTGREVLRATRAADEIGGVSPHPVAAAGGEFHRRRPVDSGANALFVDGHRCLRRRRGRGCRRRWRCTGRPAQCPENLGH